MRRSSRSLGTELWREMIERLDEGVIVFSDRGVVIYANDEAATLLGYTPRDVLELEKDDFISLCQLDRLDGAAFARAFAEGDLPGAPDRVFEVATVQKRLSIRPFNLTLENGMVTVLLLREVLNWRADLISETMMSPDMQGPLDSAAHYCNTLISRLEDGSAHPFELADLARIIQSSVTRAQGLWGNLSRLYNTNPTHFSQWDIRPLPLQEAFQEAISELKTHNSHGMPNLHLDMPDNLPPIAASSAQLHAGLCALLEGATARLMRQDRLAVIARHRRRYVQVDVTPEGTSAGGLHGYLFDSLPLAIAEQVILRHGGRVWIGARHDKPHTLSFSLPVWSEDGAAAAG
jgi:hypothetical protein